jgi:GNAT superfamily N-acetyltransferase
VNSDAAAGQELAVALSADLAARLRAAPQSVAIDAGWAVANTRLARVHHLNAIVLGTRTALDPVAHDGGLIEALTSRWQSPPQDRCVVIDDEPVAQQLEVDLQERGWERQRTLFMALRSDPSAAVRDARARRLDEHELRALQLACLQQEVIGPSVPTDLPALLAEAQALLRATTTSQRFGAGPPGGEPASSCTLFLDADVGGRRIATVEAVATLRGHREQGLARAAVSMALRAAGEWGADLIVVGADADDWPQLMYASFGFRAVGRRWLFTQRTGSG